MESDKIRFLFVCLQLFLSRYSKATQYHAVSAAAAEGARIGAVGPIGTDGTYSQAIPAPAPPRGSISRYPAARATRSRSPSRAGRRPPTRSTARRRPPEHARRSHDDDKRGGWCTAQTAQCISRYLCGRVRSAGAMICVCAAMYRGGPPSARQLTAVPVPGVPVPGGLRMYEYL